MQGLQRLSITVTGGWGLTSCGLKDSGRCLEFVEVLGFRALSGVCKGCRCLGSIGYL